MLDLPYRPHDPAEWLRGEVILASGPFGERDMLWRSRAQAARRVAFAQRSRLLIDLSCLKIGRVHVLHLPGKPMVEFQLFAQRVMPEDFVAVAELSDWSPGYICTKQAFPIPTAGAVSFNHPCDTRPSGEV